MRGTSAQALTNVYVTTPLTGSFPPRVVKVAGLVARGPQVLVVRLARVGVVRLVVMGLWMEVLGVAVGLRW